MTIKQIYDLAIKMGIEADLRGKDFVLKQLKKEKEKYKKLSKEKKEEYDKEKLSNPYSDTRILFGNPEKKIKRIMVGIDIDAGELMIAKYLNDKSKKIDLVMSHHPIGYALVDLSDVMHLQADVLHKYGVPINIAESVMRPRISEIFRAVPSAVNYNKPVHAAQNLDLSLMCVHTPADNLAASFLDKKIKKDKPETVGEVLKSLKEVPEYKEAVKHKAGPRIFVGHKEARAGKIALSEITGGTEPAKEIYEHISKAGIGTIIGMHMREENRKEAEAHHVNVIICGDTQSDSIGLNLFLDELEKRGIEIIPCSGLIRISRIKRGSSTRSNRWSFLICVNQRSRSASDLRHNMAIIKIRELIGISDKSFEDALNNVIKHELKSDKKITGVKIISQSVEVEEGKIRQYKVNVNVAYKWEERE